MHAERRTPNSQLTIAAIVPAYNESKRIGSVLKVLEKSALLHKVLVVDDGSIDNTAEVASKFKCRVIRLEKNAGKGAALQAGIKDIDADIYLFIDADLVGLEDEHIKNMLNPLIENQEIHMSVGQFSGGRRATDWAQKLVPFISGQRAMRAEVAQSLPDLANSGFGVETVITKFTKENNYKVQEVELKNITQVMKEEKLGLFKGFMYRLKMYKDIVKSVFNKNTR